MENNDAPYHPHIYYAAEERPVAARLHDLCRSDPAVLFVGKMTDRPVGPHPIAQYEIHFLETSRANIVAAIEPTGLRALVHPLTQDDLADHTTLGQWIGEPLDLDLSVMDPPRHNQGIPRFGGVGF